MEALISTYAFDTLVILAIFALIAFYNSMRGTGISLIIAVAIPIASFLFFLFPYFTEVTNILTRITPEYGEMVAKNLVFVALLAISLSLPRTIVNSGFNRRSLWRVIAISVITTVFILILILNTLDLEEFNLFSDTFKSVLTSNVSSFWIIIISLLALFFI